MSEKRYFKIEYDEEWYLFDSTTISEQLVKEQAEYGYGVFANSLSPSEVEGLLNELSEENEQLKAKASSWKITCSQEMNEKNVLFMKNRQLQEENEQLKKEKEKLEEGILKRYLAMPHLNPEPEF